MRKAIFFCLLVFLLSLIFVLQPNSVRAKKRIPRAKSTLTSTSLGNKPVIRPRLRTDRRALVVSFSNLGNVSSLSYELSYTSEGISQGVMGSLTSSEGQNVQREILFGTCSKNVCRYHRGIKGMRFVVTYSLNSGTKIRKGFQMKV